MAHIGDHQRVDEHMPMTDGTSPDIDSIQHFIGELYQASVIAGHAPCAALHYDPPQDQESSEVASL
ncbi:uncharacterized protein LAESUDRAFT_728266 [Laetiporus sulphureus 93-53]|uniref:Uncharacterized protein n=1 Tax=Laetiporus sulphureus 93-53 TaxID=1314785 RepID=A0A165D9U5_9APHY|nr:uncharacterized protein LAESUDRAFT_728266 [Laetiporus sulphureus 93-53]KZT04401.1 hypothetical protein LAESUDRAFT_728266 [Laetiporus sulphureus 93-53]